MVGITSSKSWNPRIRALFNWNRIRIELQQECRVILALGLVLATGTMQGIGILVILSLLEAVWHMLPNIFVPHIQTEVRITIIGVTCIGVLVLAVVLVVFSVLRGPDSLSPSGRFDLVPLMLIHSLAAALKIVALSYAAVAGSLAIGLLAKLTNPGDLIQMGLAILSTCLLEWKGLYVIFLASLSSQVITLIRVPRELPDITRADPRKQTRSPFLQPIDFSLYIPAASHLSHYTNPKGRDLGIGGTGITVTYHEPAWTPGLLAILRMDSKKVHLSRLTKDVRDRLLTVRGTLRHDTEGVLQRNCLCGFEHTASRVQIKIDRERIQVLQKEGLLDLN